MCGIQILGEILSILEYNINMIGATYTRDHGARSKNSRYHDYGKIILISPKHAITGSATLLTIMYSYVLSI